MGRKEWVSAHRVGGRPLFAWVNTLSCQNALQTSFLAVFFGKVGNV